MLDMLQKSSVYKTTEMFFNNPSTKFYLMDLSRRTGIAHTSIKQNLNYLVKLKIINLQKEKKGKRIFLFYQANLENKQFKRYKLVHNIRSILESELVDFIEKKLTPKSMVLFGSYSRGEDIETSDIDLFVECKKEELNLNHFEKKLGRKIELHFKEDFTLYPKELKNNIINGITLSGFLEGYK